MEFHKHLFNRIEATAADLRYNKFYNLEMITGLVWKISSTQDSS